ncbi:hypothetical protein O0L34_g10859 [Tuta absoluta]|nr:hypothetical protein O0L34_g10859 [Tuta absoluta]
MQNDLTLRTVNSKGPFDIFINSSVAEKIIETHNDTVALLKAAANDLVTNNLPTVDQAVDELKKTTDTLFQNSCKLVKSFTNISEHESKNDNNKSCNIRKSGGPKNTSFSQDDLDISTSVEKLCDSAVRTAEIVKSSITNFACQGLKTLGIEEVKPSSPPSEDPIDYLKITAEKLVSDVRKKTQEFKKMSSEERLDLLRKAKENVKNSLTDLAADSKAIFEMSPESCSDVIQKTLKNIKESFTIKSNIDEVLKNEFKPSLITDKTKNANKNNIEDDRKNTIQSHLVDIERSADNLIEYVAETTIKIQKSVENICKKADFIEKNQDGDTVGHSNKDILLEKPSTSVENSAPEKLAIVKNNTSPLSLKTSRITGYVNSEKNSASGISSPPGQIAFESSTSRVNEMFTTIKDKIYSIFSGSNKYPGSQCNDEDEDDNEET